MLGLESGSSFQYRKEYREKSFSSKTSFKSLSYIPSVLLGWWLPLRINQRISEVERTHFKKLIHTGKSLRKNACLIPPFSFRTSSNHDQQIRIPTVSRLARYSPSTFSLSVYPDISPTAFHLEMEPYDQFWWMKCEKRYFNAQSRQLRGVCLPRVSSLFSWVLPWWCQSTLEVTCWRWPSHSLEGNCLW